MYMIDMNVQDSVKWERLSRQADAVGLGCYWDYCKTITKYT